MILRILFLYGTLPALKANNCSTVIHFQKLKMHNFNLLCKSSQERSVLTFVVLYFIFVCFTSLNDKASYRYLCRILASRLAFLFVSGYELLFQVSVLYMVSEKNQFQYDLLQIVIISTNYTRHIFFDNHLSPPTGY